MHRLAMLGYHFSLDKVTDLDLDFGEIARMNFKYVRISADRLVNGMAELGARIHGADKAHYLERYGLHLIVERIETERQLATLWLTIPLSLDKAICLPNHAPSALN